MDIRAVVSGFPNAEPLPGPADAWHWSPAPGIDFAGALSADGRRLLQLSARNSYDQELAVATLEFAREHEEGIFAGRPHLGTAGGFAAPGEDGSTWWRGWGRRCTASTGSRIPTSLHTSA
ncbi:hypothetical protein ACFYW8_04315 [Streptomyces sp. NPDC002742]|uniref:hypothetical protein n=1 Tax=Streptomyces sp. NPDC002742 TaxID=3364663 RepID=UPI0036855743